MKLATLEIELLANLAKFQDTMNKASKTADVAMRNIEKSAGFAQKALGGLGAAISFQAVSKLVDDYKKFDSQLKLATKSLEEYTQAYENVIRIGRTAQSDIGAIGVLYARLNNNLRDFNVTQSEVANVAETISLALRVNNATVQETNSVMLQLSQSFGSGRLNGQEFLAVTEGAPNLMRQLAKSLNVPYGALKDLSSQGKITREDLLRAWTDPEYLAALRNNVKEVGTISSAITVATNNLKQFIGEKDKAIGASKALSQGIIFLSENISTLINVALAAAVVQLLKWTQGVYASVAAMRVKSAQTVIAAKVELSLAQAAYASGVAVNTNNKALAGNAAATTLATSSTARLVAAQTALARATSITAKAGNVLNGVFNLLGGSVGVLIAALTGLYFWIDKVIDDKKLSRYGSAIDEINEKYKENQKLVKSGIAANDPFASEKIRIKELEKARDGLFAKMQIQQKLLAEKSLFAPTQSEIKEIADKYTLAFNKVEEAKKAMKFDQDARDDRLKNPLKVEEAKPIKTSNKELKDLQQTHDALIRQQNDLNDLSKKYLDITNETHNKIIEQDRELNNILEKEITDREVKNYEELQAIQDKIDATRLEVDMHGMNKEAIEAVAIARKIETAEMLKGLGLNTEEIEKEIAMRYELLQLQVKKTQLDAAQKENVKDLKDGFSELKTAINGYSRDMTRSFADFIFGTKTSFGDMINSMLKDLARLALQKAIFDPIANGVVGYIDKNDGIGGALKSFIGFANGGIMTSKGSMPLNKYANGGIANSPQMAMFGEGRMNEAYVPLPDGRTIPVTMSGNSNEVNVYVNVTGTSSDVQSNEQDGKNLGNAIKAAVQAELIKQKRQGGLLA